MNQLIAISFSNFTHNANFSTKLYEFILFVNNFITNFITFVYYCILSCIRFANFGFMDLKFIYVFRYQIVIIIATYFIPMFLMICCYSGMSRVLWGSKFIGEMTQRQIDSIRSKRKVCIVHYSLIIIN